MGDEKGEALRFLNEGNRCQKDGDIDGAVDNYKKSIALHPTADAHTYLGWMYSSQGRIDEAVEQCKIAIELDPEFGNPYNDIGVYLMQKGELDGAEPWLRRAIQAKRYEPRHFPHLNLGRIYADRKQFGRALEEFRRAAQMAPDDPVAKAAFCDLVGKLN